MEKPLVSAQFAWNAAYRYLACDHCMRSLETAEQMARRLTGNASLMLPHSNCCNVRPSEHVTCHHCSVSNLEHKQKSKKFTHWLIFLINLDMTCSQQSDTNENMVLILIIIICVLQLLSGYLFV